MVSADKAEPTTGVELVEKSPSSTEVVAVSKDEGVVEKPTDAKPASLHQVTLKPNNTYYYL